MICTEVSDKNISKIDYHRFALFQLGKNANVRQIFLSDFVAYVLLPIHIFNKKYLSRFLKLNLGGKF